MIDVAVREGLLACLLYSIELSDCAWMDSEVWELDFTEDSGVIGGSGGTGLISRVETSVATMSTVDLGLEGKGTSMPRSKAVCASSSSKSSSDCSKRRTIIRYVSLSFSRGLESACCPTWPASGIPSVSIGAAVTVKTPKDRAGKARNVYHIDLCAMYNANKNGRGVMTSSQRGPARGDGFITCHGYHTSDGVNGTGCCLYRLLTFGRALSSASFSTPTLVLAHVVDRDGWRARDVSAMLWYDDLCPEACQNKIRMTDSFQFRS